MSDLVNINTTDFAGSARHEGDKLLLHLRGNADYLRELDAARTSGQ